MEWRQVVTMPETAGMLFDASKGFEMIPVLTTDSTYWNELQTTNFVDSIPTFNLKRERSEILILQLWLYTVK